MRKNRALKCLVPCILCAFLCVSLCTTALAVNETGVKVTLDQTTLNVSSQPQTVTMTVEAEEAIPIAVYELDCVFADAFSISAITNDDPGVGSLSASQYNLSNGSVTWIAGNAEDRLVTKLASITFTIPANTAPGEYIFGAENIIAGGDYGSTYVIKLSEPITVTLTVVGDGDAGTVPGETPPGGDQSTTPGGNAPANGEQTQENGKNEPGAGNEPSAGVVAGKSFADVKSTDWFYTAVDYVSAHGIMTGVSDTAFEPGSRLTRGMMVTVLWRMAGSPPVAAANLFDDVKSGDWYTDAVNWAGAYKLVNGYGNGMFGPTDSITREQMAVILYAYAGFRGYDMSAGADLSRFTDGASTSSWAVGAMEWAVSHGLINGKTGGVLDPAGTATRAEAATILMKFCEMAGD